MKNMCGLAGLAALAMTMSATAMPWRAVVSGANSTAYADLESISRNKATATMEVLIDYRKPPFDGNNLPYLSLTMRNEYSCDDGRFRVLSITSHADHMGRGSQPFKTDEHTEWEAVSPATIQQDLLKVACGTAASTDSAAR